MKKIIVVVAFMVFCAKGFSQVSLTLSLNPQVSMGKFRGLNYVIDRYNQTRQGQNGAATLSNNMNNIRVLGSLGWRMGINVHFEETNGMFFALNRIGRRAHTFAEGRDAAGNSVRRDLRFTANSLNLEMGYYLGAADEGFLISAGGSMDLITYKAHSKVNNGDYKEVFDDFTVGVSLFLQGDVFLHDNFSIGLRPSYQFIPITTSYEGLNEAINPATARFDAREDVSSPGGNFTLSLMMNVVLGK